MDLPSNKTLYKASASIFALTALLWAVLPEVEPVNAESKTKPVKIVKKFNHEKIEAQITCNSVIEQKYSNYELIQKLKMVRLSDHWHWRWKTNRGIITCKVWDNGKYKIF